MKHGCEINRVIYPIKNAIKTVIILGSTLIGGAFCAQAQVPQDPYPSFGKVTPGPFLQGPVVATPEPVASGPVMMSHRASMPSSYAPHTLQTLGPSQPDFSQPDFSQPTSGYLLGSRSERLERIAQDADRHTRKAFELASRGAHFSARAEFIRALRLISQGLDSDRQCRAYSQSLRAGLKALEEVDDFIPTGAQFESDLLLREIIARHQTTVLKETLLTQEDDLLPTPMEAVGAYLGYAQEQLSIAVGGEIAGSMALHGLGKLYAAKRGTELDISLSRAIVCFRVARTVCPQNHLAHNDLGVLLARSGRSSDACRVFEESLAVHPHPTTLANLAVVYHALGKKELLAVTKQRLATYQNSTSLKSNAIPAVDWVSPEKFSESYARTSDARQLPPVQRPFVQRSSDTKAKEPVKQADRSWPWSWMKR